MRRIDSSAPTEPGISRSSSTTSGRCSETASTAPSWSDASAITSMPPASENISTTPLRKRSWSSQTATRTFRPEGLTLPPSRLPPEVAGGDPALGERLLGGLAAASDAHLRVDVGQVALDGRLRDEQRGGYAAVGEPAGGEQQYLPLP